MKTRIINSTELGPANNLSPDYHLRAIVKGLQGWVVHYLLDGQDLTEFVVAPNRYSAVEESRRRHPTAYVYHAREEGTK